MNDADVRRKFYLVIETKLYSTPSLLPDKRPRKLEERLLQLPLVQIQRSLGSLSPLQSYYLERQVAGQYANRTESTSLRKFLYTKKCNGSSYLFCFPPKIYKMAIPTQLSHDVTARAHDMTKFGPPRVSIWQMVNR